MLPVPYEPEQITLAWLNEVLAPVGAPRFTALSVAPFGETGVYGRMVLINLEAADGSTAWTLVSKHAVADDHSRAALRAINVYEREFEFYRSELPAASPIRVPRCYFAAYDPDTARTCLLLELLPGAAGDDIVGATFEEGRVACRAAGAMHRHWLSHPLLKRNTWLARLSESFLAGMVGATAASQADGARALANQAPSWMLDHAGRASTIVGEQLETLAAQPCGLCHFDYRLPNLVFDRSGDTLDVALIDWQSVVTLPGVVDLGMFLFASLRVPDRRRWQDELVGEWADAVGVGDLHETSVLLRRMALFLSFNMLRNAPLIDRGNHAMSVMFDALGERAWAAAEDLDALVLL